MTKRKLFKDEVSLLPKPLRMLFSRFSDAGKELYLVGAGVRAILKMEVPKDCDITTNATPEETQEIVADLDPFYDNEFGMVGVPINDEVYEITTYRTEKGYSDARRPDKVKWGKTLEEDVIRRDFTMNSIVIGLVKKETNPKKTTDWADRQEFELIDHLDGLKDFEKGIIKSVGRAEERFGEDALRMMRAIRFASQLSFQIEEKTLSGIIKNAPLLEKISWERKRDELLKILKSNHAADGIHLLVTTGLMEYVIPEMLATRGISQTGHHTLDVYDHMLESLRNCPSTNPYLRLTALLHDIGKPKSRRLRCMYCDSYIHANNIEEKGETAKMTWYKCPRCHKTQTEHEAATFYGHEVVGARMVEEIAMRLRLPKKEIEKMVTLTRWHMFAYQREMTDASIRRFIRRVGRENINDMILLRISDRKGGGSRTTSWRLMELQKRIGEQLYEPMTISDLKINGHDLMTELKMKPGPQMGQILNALFEEVTEDTSKNTRAYLLMRAKEMID